MTRRVPPSASASVPAGESSGVPQTPTETPANGHLTPQVKHDRSAPPSDGTRFTLGNAGPTDQDRYWQERMFDTVEAVRKLADEAAVNLVTLSVAWVLANKAITAPIIGASNPKQLDATLRPWRRITSAGR
jgi:aryl-alcohol dehydrogenase-like predicted oxidoreductase